MADEIKKTAAEASEKKTDKSPQWMTFDKDKNIIDAVISKPEVLFARKIAETCLEDYIICKNSRTETLDVHL